MEAAAIEKFVKIEQGTKNLEEAAKAIIVKNDGSLATADAFLKGVKVLQKEIDDTFDPMIAKAHETHMATIAQKKKYEWPLRQAEKHLKAQIGPYLVEKERALREARERARREKEEAERKAREAEEERREEARRLERLGKIEEAKKVIEKPLPTIEVKKQEAPIPPAPKGIHTKKIWKWRLLDISLVPREYLKLDEVKIGSLVRATKGKFKIAGIETYSEDIVATREK